MNINVCLTTTLAWIQAPPEVQQRWVQSDLTEHAVVLCTHTHTRTHAHTHTKTNTAVFMV